MTPVESARTNLPYGPPAPIGRVEVSYSTRSWPRASLDRGQLEALADLIASHLQQARQDRAPDERKRLVTARQAAELLAVDLKTVYRHAQELGGRKVGGAWRFDLDTGAMEDPMGSTARYASERPEPPRAPAIPRQKRIRKQAATDGRRLLPVGRVTDRREGSS